VKNTLVIGDTHIPFEKNGYLEFCKRIYKDLNCTRVVHIGDLVDLHSCSYHEHSPEGFSPAEEMAKADKTLKKWFKAFPEVFLCKGNHDQLISRKGKTSGLPERCFKSYREMWNLPIKWLDDFQWEFEGVLYTHGTRCGKNAHLATAMDNAMSTVTGHSHSWAGVAYWSNERNLMFGMNVGSGIDRHSYAMDYGKGFATKPIISCGVVSYTPRGVNATVYPMEMK